jgi:hypothetical protein
MDTRPPELDCPLRRYIFFPSGEVVIAKSDTARVEPVRPEGRSVVDSTDLAPRGKVRVSELGKVVVPEPEVSTYTKS